MSQSKKRLPKTTNHENTAETSSDKPQPVPRKASPLPLVFAMLALGVSIGLAVGGYFIWNQVQQLTGEQAGLVPELEQKVKPLQSDLQAISNEWQTGRREIEQQLSELGEAQAALAERLNRLASHVNRSETGWTLAEVEYLLRVASESLQLRRDKRTAVAALNSADTRLRELADPQLLPVREQLARDLNRLREVPDVDFDGISLRLADDLQQVESLQVAGSRYEPPEPKPEQFDTTRSAGDWRELPQVIWAALKELFLIREHDKPVAPMLPPERVWFLKENLRLQLAAARLALLREDRQAYRQALDTAAVWLRDWFDTGDPAVAAMAQGLDELAAVDIHPELPDVSKSLQLLHGIQKQQENLALPAVVEPPAVAPEAEANDAVNEANTETVLPSVEEAPVTAEDAP
ncbi:uroporphyrin-3 C-methyltransferase [Thiogranum longum]|uniref:Uroporphyrin-3 C-methyltransferase n=1 Tax=Thiogranum longum TaxID=1537524 RepID=A0A4R1H8P2_9GAMM|nr:uroporphyrinogen-III C-methyltransferase [Thiogranum longum]TCK16813.1 uroporphyrin-3 C-methyltransferase [Thiogranum longum]